ncbi:Tol-Pal system protein TolB [Dyadobacter sp. CECT 9275]|uniref:Tol-Pal system protein TolB n=1 Tax=Dyadobacter helix TaxID=2822344 RepID=A0A916JB38_9BACT|nr:hypothetical protein [Dyadobacter sp. CECT 9275]CAG4992423.1 Tol-Pal system protein TolB [Dyadobacter sp. CECT 9275]
MTESENLKKTKPAFFLRKAFSMFFLLGLVFKTHGQKIPDCLIGYTELRTNLPGGRQPNVNTMRAAVVGANGKGRRQLANQLISDPNTMTQFAGWSPDGKLAIIGSGWKSPENARWEEENKSFRNTEGNMRYDSYLFDIERNTLTSPTQVDRVSYSNTGLFFWPGDSAKLGFTALINNISHPFKMDRDGRNKVDLTRSIDGFTYGFSASKDGRYVAYHKDYQVYIAKSDGSDARRIETGNHFNFAPQWSPDGRYLLFVSGERNTSCDPYLVDFDGPNPVKLADRNGYKGSIEFLDVFDYHEGSSDVPVWSADGKSVFYTAILENAVELFQIYPGQRPVRLTHSEPGTLHYHPKPSPDGKWLLYGSKRKGVRQLFMMELKGQAERQITKMKEGTAAMWPHWQPVR